MKEKLEYYQKILVDHYMVVLLVMALMALTIAGIGSRRIVGLTGCVLCAAAFTKGETKIDLWVLIPVIVYEVFNALSSLHTFGDVFHGFFNTQIIYPVIYFVIAYLSEKERLWLHRLCALWAALISVYGIFEFVQKAFTDDVARLESCLGNPNALGIFLVVAWFSVRDSEPGGNETGMIPELLKRIEPLILTALALTLSMGSFLSMAVGVLILWIRKSRHAAGNELVSFSFCMAAEILLGVGPGILLYFVAVMTSIKWICAFIIIYLMFLAFYWPLLHRFLVVHKRIRLIITLGGVLMAVPVLLFRSNAASTFTERFQMMRNGLGYLFREPVLGLGPYQWRYFNMSDGDIYFNTWYIHNSLLHIGVEIGLIAMAMLIVIIVRRCRKGGGETAGFMSFLIHNMIDTGFFYPGITVLTMLTTANPGNKGRTVNRFAANVFFAVFFAIFVCTGFHDAF